MNMNYAASLANGQIWPKVMQIPLVYEMNGLSTAHLKDSTNPNIYLMNVSAAPGAPRIFEFVCPSNAFFIIAQINLVIVDAAVTSTKFGGGAALTNGIIWRVVDASNNLLFNFHSNPTIKMNYEFFNIAGTEIQLQTGADLVTVSWKSSVIGVLATIRPGWKIQVVIQDDLTALDFFEASVTGAFLPPDLIFRYFPNQSPSGT